MPADTPEALRSHLAAVMGELATDAPGWARDDADDASREGVGGATDASGGPPSDSTVTWWYAPDQYELGVLHRLVREGFAANRFVDYAMNFGATEPVTTFARDLDADETDVELAASGSATVEVDGVRVEARGGAGEFHVSLPVGAARIEVVVHAPEGVPAALAEIGDAHAWHLRTADGLVPAEPRPGTAATAPHDAGEPLVEVPVRRLGPADWEVDPPALGRPLVESAVRPRIGVGETGAEALATGAAAVDSETRIDVVEAAPGVWTTSHEVAMRYLHVEPGESPASEDAQIRGVRVEARRRRMPRAGAYACSDDVLTRIWATSARTLATCMQSLMIDGIKRDRMPWIGDHALGILANAFAAGDAAIARDSLVALGRPRHGFVNGIADYSLWWLIAVRSYVRHFGDDGFARREAAHVRRFLETMDAFADADGVLRPVAGEDAFGPAGERAVFIDWGVAFDDGRDPTALQVLWYWALRDGAEVLDLAGADDAAGWAARARGIRSTLLDRAWDTGRGAWRTYLDEGPGAVESALAGYPNFLAVLAGLEADAAERPVAAVDGRAEAITATATGTPFMRAFALLALARLGQRTESVARIRTRWGGMLDAGAATFWEEFGVDDEGGHAAMYGRPFGRSLAHAWASGPAALLPEAVLGIRPLDDGWRVVSVAPELGALEWAAAIVPTPAGDLFVHADRAGVRVKAPDGVVVRLPEGDGVSEPVQARGSSTP